MEASRHLPRGRRAYRSGLRAAQAAGTRARILEAVVGLVGKDANQLSFASIARAADVSLPTVYRHFPTKHDLFEAYRLHVEGTSVGDDPRTLPTSVPAMAPLVRAFFKRFDDPSDPIGGVNRLQPSMAWEFSRAVTVPRRQAWINAVIAAECPGIGHADRARLADLLVVLVSASMGEALRGYLGRSADDMSDRVLFAIRALLAYGRQRPGATRRAKEPR